MTIFLTIIHVTICLILIGIVLIQGGKGAELGSAFGGGSSQTIFGGRGAATFMNKLTTAIAIAFMVTSLILTVLSVKQGSIVKSTVIPEEKTIPAPPAEVAPGGKEKPAKKEKSRTSSDNPAGE